MEQNEIINIFRLSDEELKEIREESADLWEESKKEDSLPYNCPHCRGDSLLGKTTQKTENLFYVFCATCGTQTAYFKNRAQAVFIWNLRRKRRRKKKDEEEFMPRFFEDNDLSEEIEEDEEI